ncbi:helix-turn-helix domain-containing protein [Kribbella sandramycini]|uniref:Excisionase family DNA binding protein n=1 Tax=Kribbella sandramycini TaxID=60450 RepID=A0A7Y4P1F1_9ACTN|nr:helix-turn-helix domain-containing protein [Kribbella sandramycini]MBB6571559.1 excisionase family DNA binding protein [Kribbella sandramycini]NOL44207.1 helix-turn-helix domain-containing protein [Kribbella sandramycini]
MHDFQVLLTVEEVASALRIGRTVVFKLISDRELRSVTIGRSRRVSVEALQEYVKRLETALMDEKEAGNAA